MERTGDQDIRFNIIYEKYCRLVMEIVLSILENRELAEDAFQATFISVARNLAKMDNDPTKIKNYIAKTAHNKALKILKKQQKIRKNEVAFPDEELDNNDRKSKRVMKEFSVESFEDEVLKNYDRIRLLESLEEIDEKYAMYIEDYYYNGLTFGQIAEKYQINEEAAKKRVYRSVKKLRDKFFRKGE